MTNPKKIEDLIEFGEGRISVEDLLSNNYKSTPRNKLIADFCKSIGLIEKYGSGIQRILKYFSEAQLPDPDFRNISEGFMVTIFIGESSKVTDKVTDNQKAIITIILEDKTVTTRELSLKIGISQRKIKENIGKLKDGGIIRRVGSAKSGHWEILP